MKNNLFQNIAISVIMIVLLACLVSPFHAWMPTMMVMTVTVALLIAFALFASFVWKEKPRDEREALHRIASGRIAYLVGAALLVVGIVYQTLGNRLDPWLVIVLSSMILAKVIGVAYGQLKN